MPVEIKIWHEDATQTLAELRVLAGGLTTGSIYTGPLTPGGIGAGGNNTAERSPTATASVQAISAEAAATHDSAGLPWDERIHSSNKAFNADGTWRRRRGVSDDLVKRIDTELRGGAAPATSTAVEAGAQAGTSDTPETEAQDEADEQAESEASKKKLSRDDVRTVLGKYVQKYGMDAAQEDGPKVIALMFGEGKNKVSDIPEDQDSLAIAIAGVEEMLTKNPFKRAEVA